LTFRPLSEAFIRGSWYSVLPVLNTTGRRRIKKAVVCVAQLVAEHGIKQKIKRQKVKRQKIKWQKNQKAEKTTGRKSIGRK